MKKLLIGLLVLGSFSSFAADYYECYWADGSDSRTTLKVKRNIFTGNFHSARLDDYSAQKARGFTPVDRIPYLSDYKLSEEEHEEFMTSSYQAVNWKEFDRKHSLFISQEIIDGKEDGKIFHMTKNRFCSPWTGCQYRHHAFRCFIE